MSVCPRIVFTRFTGFESPKANLWRAHLTRVTGRSTELPSSEASDSTVIAWSLVSANNRELARGFQAQTRFEDAVTEVERVIAVGANFEPHLVNDRVLGGYGWYLTGDDEPEMVCARWYDSDRDRRAGLRAARAALGIAALSPGVRAVPISHPVGAL